MHRHVTVDWVLDNRAAAEVQPGRTVRLCLNPSNNPTQNSSSTTPSRQVHAVTAFVSVLFLPWITAGPVPLEGIAWATEKRTQSKGRHVGFKEKARVLAGAEQFWIRDDDRFWFCLKVCEHRTRAVCPKTVSEIRWNVFLRTVYVGLCWVWSEHRGGVTEKLKFRNTYQRNSWKYSSLWLSELFPHLTYPWSAVETTTTRRCLFYKHYRLSSIPPTQLNWSSTMMIKLSVTTEISLICFYLENFLRNLREQLLQLRKRSSEEPLEPWRSLQHHLTNQWVNTWKQQ